MRRLPDGVDSHGYTILGDRYTALSNDGKVWNICRGRFHLATFWGNAQEAKLEVARWDATANSPSKPKEPENP